MSDKLERQHFQDCNEIPENNKDEQKCNHLDVLIDFKCIESRKRF